MRPLFSVVPLVLAMFLAQLSPAQSALQTAENERLQRHNTAEWKLIEPHLPDMATASPAQLELEGDVLRARRLEEDALEFYEAALHRGGDEAELLNRIGITQLVLRRPELARADFRRVIALHPKNAQAWNNLGAAEYFAGNNKSALANYGKAVRLDRQSALFHSNLGTAYFELKDYESAGKQFQIATRLNPAIFEQVSGGGLEAHPLSSNERGRFCFELARVAAEQKQDESVLHWLQKSIDAGFDIRNEMQNHSALAAYQNDPRVLLLVANARAMHPGKLASNVPITPLSEVASRE